MKVLVFFNNFSLCLHECADFPFTISYVGLPKMCSADSSSVTLKLRSSLIKTGNVVVHNEGN